MVSIYDVSKEISSRLKKYKDLKNIEIEAKIVLWENSDLEKIDYDFILGLLSSRLEFEEYYSIDYYKGNDRITETDSEYYVTSKEMLYFKKLNLESGILKFKVNREQNKKTKKSSTDGYDFTREKFRHTFTDGNLKIDVTKVIQEEDIKYEFEIEVIDPKKFSDKEFSDSIATYLKILSGYENILNRFCNQQLSNGKDRTNSFIKRSLVSRPRDLKKIDITSPNSILQGFTVSIKADGEPYFLVFHQLGIWLISLNNKIYLSNLNKEYQDLSGSIFIGELITKEKLRNPETSDFMSIFVPFDTISYKNVSQVNKNYLERISLFSNIKDVSFTSNGIKILKIHEKKIFDLGETSEQFYQSFRECYQEKKDIIYHEDGYIFTPKNNPFVTDGQKNNVKNLSKNLAVCKFKPVEKKTIDLEVIGDKVYFTGLDNEKTEFKSLKFTLDFEEDIEGKIVEFVPEFIEEEVILRPLRIRTDKEFPNGIGQIRDNIESYFEKNPITEDTLLGNDTVLMRNFNNNIKRNLINQIEGYVVDIGSGPGGDIAKFGKNSKIKKVLSVEPNEYFNKEFNERLKNSKFKDKFKLLESTKGEDVEKIIVGLEDWFPKSLYNEKLTITFMISLSFFWSSEENLRKISNTILSIKEFYNSRKGNLKPEIVFYTIDGYKVEEFFKTLGSDTFISNTITLKFSNEKEVFVDIKDSKTVSNQVEYLVKLDKMNEITGGEIVFSKEPHVKDILMSSGELQYISLFTYGKIVLNKSNKVINFIEKLPVSDKLGIEDENGKILAKGDDILKQVPEISKNIYRISTMNKGGSLIHSVLKILKPEYRDSDIKGRLKMVEELKSENLDTVKKISDYFNISVKIYKDFKSDKIGIYSEFILLMEFKGDKFEPLVYKDKDEIHYTFEKSSYLI